MPSFTSIALFVFELSRIFGRGGVKRPPPGQARVNTRTGKGGGADSALPSCFCVNIFRSIRSIAVIFSIPVQKRRTFWCTNWRRFDFGGLFLSLQSQHFRFSPSWCHDGVSWPPPPPALAGWARPVAGGGGGAGRALGGAGRALGGRRRPVKVTDSRERRPGEPSSGGHRPGGRRRRANEDEWRARVNIPTCATHRLEN